MKEVQSTKYICEICGTGYDNKILALNCENIGTYITKLESMNLQKNHWYVIKSNNAIYLDFIYSIYGMENFSKNINNTSYRCIDFKPSLLGDDDVIYNLYHNICHSLENTLSEKIISPHYEILEILTIKQAYEKHKVLPRFVDINSAIYEEYSDMRTKILENKLKKLTYDDIKYETEIIDFLLDDIYGRRIIG